MTPPPLLLRLLLMSKITFIEFLLVSLNPIPYGLFNKPKVMGGGRSAPPSYMANGGYFQYSCLTAQPSTLKIVALNFFLKNHQCWQKS